MNKYRVIVNIYRERETLAKELIVEAGSKKLATLRALLQVNETPEFKELYKNVKSVELIGG